MAEKLGILLVQKQLVTPEQVEEAAKLQVIYGGRIGTNLIELGYLDLDSLASVLAEQRRLQAVTLAELDAATQATLDLIPAALAEKHLAFPLRVDRRSLHVAMASPFDFETVDALGFATGYRIVPKICPELRLLYYLEKRYGIERKARYIRLAEDRPAARPPPATSTGAVDRRKYLTATPELTQAGPAREFDSALKPLGAGEYLTSEEDDLYTQSGGSLTPNLATPAAAPAPAPAAPAPLSPSAARRAALGIAPGQVPVGRSLTPPGVPVAPPLAPAAPPTLAPTAPPTLPPAEPPTLAPQPLSPSAARRAALGLGPTPAAAASLPPSVPPVLAGPPVIDAPPIVAAPPVLAAPPVVAAPPAVPAPVFATPVAQAPRTVTPPEQIVPSPSTLPDVFATPVAPAVNVLAQDATSPFAPPPEPQAVAPQPDAPVELDALELEPLAEEEVAIDAPEATELAVELEPEPLEEIPLAADEVPEPAAEPVALTPPPAPPAATPAPSVVPEPAPTGPSLVPLAAAEAGDLATMQWDLAFDAPPLVAAPLAPPAEPVAAPAAVADTATATPPLPLSEAIEAAEPASPPAATFDAPIAASVEASPEAVQPDLAPAPEPEPTATGRAEAGTLAAADVPIAQATPVTEAPAAAQPSPNLAAAPAMEAAPADGLATGEFAPSDADAAFLAAFDASRAHEAEASAATPAASAAPEAEQLELLAIPDPATDADAPKEPEPELRSPPGMLLVEEVLARGTDREKLADALTWFAEGRFSFNLILVVRGNIAAGCQGFGPGIDRRFIERLHVPLDQPSILTAAIDARAAVVRERAETSLDRRLLAYCGLHPRSSLVAFPIFARERLVNVVVGSRGSWPMRENTVDEANRVAAAVGRAYERLLLLRKRIDE